MRKRWILLLVLFSFAVASEDGLPGTEKELLAYAEKHSNRREWPKAEQAYAAFLERYPKSAQSREVHYRLGRLHLYYSRRYEHAAEWYDALIAKFPQDEWAWHARSDRAEVFARMRKIDAAVALLRKVSKEAPDARLRSRAARRILSVQNKYFSLSVRQSFTVGEAPHVRVQSRNVGEASFRIERAPYDEVIERLDPERLDLTAAAREAQGRVTVKEWTERFAARRDHWSNRQVDLPRVEEGVYLVEAATEGLTFHVTVLVNNFGLIVKSGAEQVLVFAQGRRHGEPEAGVRVRLVTKSGVSETVTGERGLGRFDAVGESALLVGVRGDEYCFCSVHAWNRAGPESRVYVTTDRPLYRPGHEVRFKVLHRLDTDGELGVHAGLKLNVTILDPKNETAHAETVELSRFGTAHGSFTLGEEPPLGQYRVMIEPVDGMPGQWNRWSNQGRFRVDEYRKPEYEVSVAFAEPRYVQGDKVRAVVEARYFFGSPVSGGKVEYVVSRARHWSYWGGAREPWLEWYGDVARHHGGGEQIEKGAGELDADGRLVVEFDAPRDGHDVRYTVAAAVTDRARRQERGATSVVAHRAAVQVHVATKRYVYLPGQDVEAEVEVRDLQGAPVSNHAVTVHALRRVWSREKKEYREVALGKRDVTTGENGKATAKLAVADAGSIVLRAAASDAKGRETSDDRWVWVTSDDWRGGTMNWRGLTIVADKPSYAPGETATFLLTSEVEDIHLLFTLECRRIYHHEVVKMNGHTATVKVKLDDRGLLPNFFATATGLHANKTYQRQINVVVDPTERFLQVEIRPDRERYKPRAKAKFEIVTRNAKGEPVAAEVEFAAVDEAIYALQEEYAQDIRAFFLRRRWNAVQTNSSIQYRDWGRPEAEEMETLDEDAGSDFVPPGTRAPAEASRRAEAGLAGGAGFVEPVVRTEFADTLLWRPSVVTGEDGRAVVEIDELADNLTTWRLTARGMGPSGRMGQERSSILVRKEVIARLAVPRFFTQGDRPVVTAIARNDLDTEKQVKIELLAEGIVVDGERSVLRTVGPKQEVRVEWRARVERPGMARFVLKALTDTESDALEKKVPVLPHGSLQWDTRSGIVEAESAETLSLAPDAMPEASRLTVQVTPTHAATVLGALDYLADYPYGCVEQTMSRFLPSTITRQVLRRLDIRKPWLEKHLPEMIRAGLDRLAGFQHPDGGWGWWKNDESNPFTTAYVVYGLALARETDAPVDGKMLARGVAALKRMIGGVETDEERVYVLYALSAAGEKVPGVRNALADGAPKLPPAAQAMLAMVLHRDGEKKEAKRVLGLLVEGASRSGATASWPGTKSYRWTGHRVEATALALDALLAIEPGHELTHRVVTWLALNQDGGHWISTRQTAMVVMAVSRYLEKTGTAAPRMTLTLEINGKELWTRTVTPANWAVFDGRTVVPAADLAPGENRVVIRKEGEGSPVYSVFLRQFKRKASFEPSQGGLRVDRTYQVVRDGKAKPIDGPLRSGDEVLVTLTVRADRRYDYLMIEDPMPAGFEAERDAPWGSPYRGGRWTWGHWWSHREFRDEKVAIAVTRMPAGERTVSYRMRAEQPGLFRALPTQVWNMYEPGEGANGGGASFEVLPGEDE